MTLYVNSYPLMNVVDSYPSCLWQIMIKEFGRFNKAVAHDLQHRITRFVPDGEFRNLTRI